MWRFCRFGCHTPLTPSNTCFCFRVAATNKHELQSLGVTHVLNCAYGTKAFGNARVETGFFDDVGIQLHQILADDRPNFKISTIFEETNTFISQAIASGGRIFVYCMEGFSRSATVVIAYLMYEKRMSVRNAVEAVRRRREVCPNEGFLQQLIDYGYEIGVC